MSAPGAKPGLTGDIAGALALIGMLALAILPLPPVGLDFLLSLSLCLSLLIFLVAIYVEKPLEFSSFPSLLVLITLFRMTLNLASTRMILLHGADGTDAAGQVIRAFGDFAVGGNFVVGAVVFLILVVVNFIVITKGADRISEVAARFTLDSMPGKQMAIDSDMVAGLIDEHQARTRRKDLQTEADFHGAMDGASKFVRGDAIAGLLIVGINVIAGIIVGVAQHGMPLGDAATTFTILSIGDGLVSQIPALLVSTGAALLVTRDSSGAPLLGSVGHQLLSRPRPAAVVAGVLGGLGLVPGMPHVALLALAGLVGYVARRASLRQAEANRPSPTSSDTKGPTTPAEQKAEIESLLPLELLSMEVGVGLLPLVDQSREGELLTRIAAVRRQLALELGFIVPPIHIRDDLRARPGGYRILISGVKVAEGEVRPGRFLAIDPGRRASAHLPGEAVQEPTFGLPAKWIATPHRSDAEAAGCTVVDASAVIATHITETVRRHSAELLGRREAQELVDVAGRSNSRVVEELLPHLLSLGDVIKVLRNLLTESVSVRDIRTILETLADNAATIKDPGELTELVRQRLGRQIASRYVDAQGRLNAFVLAPEAEDLLRKGGRGSDPNALTNLTNSLIQAAKTAADRDEPAIALVAPDVRRSLAAIAQRHVPGLVVMSYRELDGNIPLQTRGIVNFAHSNQQVA